MRIRSALYFLHSFITGRKGDALRFKREVHRLRQAAERKFLAETRTAPEVMRPNSCPVCERRLPAVREFTNPTGFHFVVCPADGTIYMDPVPSEAALARLYNDDSENFKWRRGSDAASPKAASSQGGDYEALRRWLPDSTHRLKLLDVGCANGEFLAQAQASYDVEGCEMNISTATEAVRRGFTVWTGRVEDVPIDRRYDVVTLLQVLEHIVQPLHTLKHVRDRLNPGGYLYAQTPNIESASFGYLQSQHRHVSTFQHVSLFNHASLARLCERAGFEIVQHEYCGGRDLSLHDLISHRLFPKRFSHRMALYSPRFLDLMNLLESTGGRMLERFAFPTGNPSYQRILARRAD